MTAPRRSGRSGWRGPARCSRYAGWVAKSTLTPRDATVVAREARGATPWRPCRSSCTATVRRAGCARGRAMPPSPSSSSSRSAGCRPPTTCAAWCADLAPTRLPPRAHRCALRPPGRGVAACGLRAAPTPGPAGAPRPGEAAPAAGPTRADARRRGRVGQRRRPGCVRLAVVARRRGDRRGPHGDPAPPGTRRPARTAGSWRSPCPVATAGSASCSGLAVDPAVQRGGLGRRLVLDSLRWAARRRVGAGAGQHPRRQRRRRSRCTPPPASSAFPTSWSCSSTTSRSRPRRSCSATSAVKGERPPRPRPTAHRRARRRRGGSAARGAPRTAADPDAPNAPDATTARSSPRTTSASPPAPPVTFTVRRARTAPMRRRSPIRPARRRSSSPATPRWRSANQPNSLPLDIRARLQATLDGTLAAHAARGAPAHGDAHPAGPTQLAVTLVRRR